MFLHRYLWLLSLGLAAFSVRAHQASHKRTLLAAAATHHSHRVLRLVLQGWGRVALPDVDEERRLRARAARLWRQHLLRRAVRGWAVQARRCVQSRADGLHLQTCLPRGSGAVLQRASAHASVHQPPQSFLYASDMHVEEAYSLASLSSMWLWCWIRLEGAPFMALLQASRALMHFLIRQGRDRFAALVGICFLS